MVYLYSNPTRGRSFKDAQRNFEPFNQVGEDEDENMLYSISSHEKT